MKKFTGILLAVLLIFTAVSCSFFMEEKNNNTESLVSFSLSGKSSKDGEQYYISEYITYGESTVQYGTWTDMAWDIWYYTTDTEASAFAFTTASDIHEKISNSDANWIKYDKPFRVTKGVTVWAYCENTLTSATNKNVTDEMFKGIAHEKVNQTKTYITINPELDEKVAFKENTTGTVLIDAIKYVMSKDQFDVLSSGTDLKKLQVKVKVGDKEVVTVTDITFTTDTNNEYTTATAIFTNVEVAGAKVSEGGTTPSNIKLEFIGLKADESTATDCEVYNIFELSTEGKKGVADIYVLNSLTTELKGITVENKTIILGSIGIEVTDNDMFPHEEGHFDTPSSPTSFHFEALASGVTVKLVTEGEPAAVGLVYAVNGSEFKNYNIGDTITLTDMGDRVFFKAKTSNTNFSKDVSNYYYFVINGDVNCNGRINYLLEKDGNVDKVPDYAFIFLFNKCSTLKSAPELPAMKMGVGCYKNMFLDCTSLTKAPALPATALADECYLAMFGGCVSLTKAPSLPATTLSKSCYQGMFNCCTSLTDAPVLHAATLTENCYWQMFYGCTSLSNITMLATDISAKYCMNQWLSETASTGTFTKTKGVEISTGVNGIPSGWAVVEK